MTNAAVDADRFAAAHAALKADRSIQFNFTSPPKPPESPEWLRDLLEWLGKMLEPVGRFLKWIGSFMPDAPLAQIILWGVLILCACALAWGIYHRLRYGEWRWPKLWRSAQFVEADAEPEWVPDFAPAREWLREADALAEQGRYAEAARHLLLRSIEDIAKRRPHLVRPALTSREIGSADAIPDQARGLFVGIVRLVERSLFGGRAVDRDEWTGARTAYSDFVTPQIWRA